MPDADDVTRYMNEPIDPIPQTPEERRAAQVAREEMMRLRDIIDQTERKTILPTDAMPGMQVEVTVVGEVVEDFRSPDGAVTIAVGPQAASRVLLTIPKMHIGSLRLLKPFGPPEVEGTVILATVQYAGQVLETWFVREGTDWRSLEPMVISGMGAPTYKTVWQSSDFQYGWVICRMPS